MNTRASVIIAAASSFAGGFLLGLLVAPESGREARQRLSRAAHGSTRWVEDRLREIEAQLQDIEKQLQDAGIQISDRVRNATEQTLEHFVPSMPDETEWDIEQGDVSQDLRHMPRR